MGLGGIWWQKNSISGLAGDWLAHSGSIVQTVKYSDFVDGTSTAGSLTLTYGIPIHMTVKRCFLQALTGFTGDASCTLIVGDGSITDRYMTGTPSIYTTAAGETSLGVVSGTAYHAAAKSIVLSAVSATDWGKVTAGQFTIVLVLE